MTTLLDDAIACVRDLSDSEQDLAAEAIFAVIGRDEPNCHLTPEQVAEVEQVIAGLKDGSERLATDEEVEAMWKRFGV